MMKVLFIYTNINGFHEDCYSFGLASIVAVTRVKGHDVRVMIVKEKSQYQDLLEQVAAFKPQVVGMTAVSSQFGFVKEISSLIKEKCPGTTIVCGGVHLTINPDAILDAPGLDAIFVGESEGAFADFLDRVGKNESYKDVHNLAYVEGGRVRRNPLKPLLKDLDDLPYPDKELCPYGETIRTTGCAHFLFSRGCPYLCSYCSNHKIAQRYGLERNTARFRSVESSIREIEEVLSKFSVSTIWIMDDIFGLDKKWRAGFCAEYKKRIRIPFTCLLRVNVIDEEFMRLLKDAGCSQVFIGLESGNDFVRMKVMNRQMTNEQIVNAFRLAHKCGLKTNAINMVGLPGETEEMIWDTIKLNRLIKPASSCVSIFYPYKGTKLGDDCFARGLVDEARYAGFSNERRESVLNFPEAYRRKLVYYHTNWERLVYPYDLKRNMVWALRRTFIWKYLRAIKNAVLALKKGSR